MRQLNVGLVGALVALAAVGCARPMSQPQTATSTEPVPDCTTMTPPCPPASSPRDLSTRETHSDAGFKFEPAPETRPQISASDALAIAWNDGGMNATSAQLIYALLPAGGSISTDTPVWIVRFLGACVPVVGPPLAPGETPASPLPSCAGTEWNVIVDATNGYVIASFSDQ